MMKTQPKSVPTRSYRLRADLRTALRQYRNLMHAEYGVSREDSPARRVPWYREMIDRHGFEGEIDRDLIDGKYFF